jgi:peptide deformylase
MSTFQIVTGPDPRLKQASLHIEEVNNEIRAVFDKMLMTMHKEDGIGLAAVQVGVMKRLMIIDATAVEDRKEPFFMANPEIVYASPEVCVYPEGCLSFPGARLEIERPEFVKIRYLDYHNEQREIEAEELLARVFQHEFDHLNGITFVDHLSPLKREMTLKRVLKFKKLYK